MSKVSGKITGVIDRNSFNSTKFINFKIYSGMIWHKMRINKSTGTITHYYHILSSSEYNTLKGIINNGTNTNRQSYENTNIETGENLIGHIINSNTVTNFFCNAFCINTAHIKTSVPIQ